MIEIEPHLKLVEYFNITQTFTSNLTPDIFYNNGEHYNVLSDINQNIFLLRQLAELNFLKKSNWVCDCGLGLGNALYDIYLQSNEIEFDFQDDIHHLKYLNIRKYLSFHYMYHNLIK